MSEKMSDKTAAVIVLAEIGGILVFTFGAISTTLTIGSAVFMVGGVAGLMIAKSKSREKNNG